MVHSEGENLGMVIKNARHANKLTVEELADRCNVTERYIYRIENEGKKPSYDVLFKLIRVLSINPDSIFYPEKPSKDSEEENLIRMLYDCDDRSLKLIKALIKAIIENGKE